jgi:hypothetical protein
MNMAHFAKLKDGVVVDVIVIEPEVLASGAWGPVQEWIQTSVNTRGGVHYTPGTDQPSADQSKALRKNFAGIGYTYDVQRDAFIPPKPYASWVLNEQTCQWGAPQQKPTDGKPYDWDESIQQWVSPPADQEAA